MDTLITRLTKLCHRMNMVETANQSPGRPLIRLTDVKVHLEIFWPAAKYTGCAERLRQIPCVLGRCAPDPLSTYLLEGERL
jgi:hypothetical protein